MKRLKQILYRFISGAMLLIFFWWALSLLLGKEVIIAPWTVYKALPHLVIGAMWQHLSASLYRLFLGISIAFLLGIFLAFVIFRFRHIGQLINSFTYLAYPIPKVALLPIVMLIAGLGDAGKVTMIVLILIFQVIVNVRDSLLNIPKESFIIATSLGASSTKVARHILLPAVLPVLFSSLRVAIGVSISVLFVTETYGTEQGMGYFIIDAWMRFCYIDMYGGIVVLSTVGFFFFILTDILEDICCPWKEAFTYSKYI